MAAALPRVGTASLFLLVALGCATGFSGPGLSASLGGLRPGPRSSGQSGPPASLRPCAWACAPPVLGRGAAGPRTGCTFTPAGLDPASRAPSTQGPGRSSSRPPLCSLRASSGQAERTGGLSSWGQDEDDGEDEDSAPPRYEGTIYAQSTAVGMGGIAVLRVSGPEALASLARVSRPGVSAPKPRYATLRTLVEPGSGDIIDKALVLYFPGPNSFTGEDIVEYHVHGGIAIVNNLLTTLGETPGLRMAARGEFTRRAFENGRMDLLEAEALNDLIHAETSRQQKQAMLQMGGAHRELYQGWRTGILQCLAHVNAFIDYGESEGLEEEETLAPVRSDAEVIENQIQQHLSDGKRGEALRSGLQCSLVGPPNAGKSSLLNFLAARPAAIVSSIPGTTRDIVQVRLEIGGVAVSVDDTAGLRGEGADEVEEEGMRRSAASFQAAQLRVIVLDGSDIKIDTVRSLVGLLNDLAPAEEVEREILQGKGGVGNWGWSRNQENQRAFDDSEDAEYNDDDDDDDEEDDESDSVPIVVVLNKCDLLPGGEDERADTARQVEEAVGEALGARDVRAQWVSCATGEGLDELLGALGEGVTGLVADSDGAPSITRARHRELLKKCASALRRFRTSNFPVDAQAEELALAMDAVGKIYGEADTEEMLDVVFRDFCVGK